MARTGLRKVVRINDQRIDITNVSYPPMTHWRHPTICSTHNSLHHYGSCDFEPKCQIILYLVYIDKANQNYLLKESVVSRPQSCSLPYINGKLTLLRRSKNSKMFSFYPFKWCLQVIRKNDVPSSFTRPTLVEHGGIVQLTPRTRTFV